MHWLYKCCTAAGLDVAGGRPGPTTPVSDLGGKPSNKSRNVTQGNGKKTIPVMSCHTCVATKLWKVFKLLNTRGRVYSSQTDTVARPLCDSWAAWHPVQSHLKPSLWTYLSKTKQNYKNDKTTILPGLAGGENCVIIRSLVLSQYQRVTDRRTDRQTTQPMPMSRSGRTGPDPTRPFLQIFWPDPTRPACRVKSRATLMWPLH